MNQQNISSELSENTYAQIKQVLLQARATVLTTVNTAMVQAYWYVGKLIVEAQGGEERAAYGDELLKSISFRLTKEFGKGFDTSNLRNMRMFYLSFPKCDALRHELSWTHYRALIRVSNPKAREYYANEAAAGKWSTRQLERQIATQYYERMLSTHRDSVEVEDMIKRNLPAKPDKFDPLTLVHDPFILEFIGAKEDVIWQESELESALISHLEEFLLELGRGFAFMGRQKRITIDGQHFYPDLVFYNVLTRSYLLPSSPVTVLSDKTTEIDPNARITFSTYQTMINYVNTDRKPYSVGRFDLIIIDEAHRSVFGKYGDIFRYFDSLLVGLTATPRDQVDKSTNDLLHLEGGEPTDYYEYETAVEDGYLVDYTGLIRGSKVVNEGIRYDDLLPEEKEQLEAVWEYEQVNKDPDEEWESRDIREQEIFKYIYNTDTIDKMLQDLMENGLKVQSGELIGKSIIFAMNSKTAKLIVERFHILYPQYGDKFCEQIDYSIEYSQDFINKFSLRDSMPQIAVSVDMLDTGIDVPDVLNLVFFKRVWSRIKFMQMIGRGTRLSPDIFGAGEDKERFYIFDWGGNFKYFGQNPKERKAIKSVSLTERLFGVRAAIACALQAAQYQADDFAKGFHDELKMLLQNDVAKLNDAHISVRNHWPAVSKYRDPDVWQYISEVDVLDLKNEIAPLLPKTIENEPANKFDLLSLYVQLGLVDETYESEAQEAQITKIVDALRKQASVPDIKAKMPLLNEVMTSAFWNNKTLFSIERDLPVLRKIQNIEKLSSGDIDELERILWQELGTKEDYERYLRREKMTTDIPVAAFIRKVAGLDRQKAIKLFTEFVSANALTAEQEEFINNILNYVCQNGDMAKTVFRDNRIFRESLLKYFSNKAAQVA